MARKRYFSQEFRRSPTIRAWPRDVRLTFGNLILAVDDEGRIEYDLHLLKAELFPSDTDVTPRRLDGWVTVLLQVVPGDADGLPALCSYQVDGRDYLHAVKWHGYQNLSHPTPSKLPPCPEHPDLRKVSRTAPEPLANGSGRLPESFAKPSRNPRDALRNRSGARVRAREVEIEGEEEVLLAPAAPPPGKPTRERDEIWDALLIELGIDGEGMTAAARGPLNAATKQLRQVGASAEQIRDRARLFRVRYPSMTLTGMALAKHWPQLSASVPPRGWEADFGMGPGSVRTFDPGPSEQADAS